MSSRQRNRGASRTQPSGQGSPGTTGFVMGLVAGVVLTLAGSSLLHSHNQPTDSKPTAASTSAGQQADSSQPPSHFQFYTLLNDLEVTVPNAVAEEKANEEVNTLYWLQAGSFRNRKDAEKLRETVMKMNMNATISQLNYQGTVWQRVMAGPFHSRTNMAAARQTLIEHNIEPMLFMEKQPSDPSKP